MSDSFYIGALARETGRSIHTIRWYETQGLIPNVGRDRGGRRVYVREHVDHLSFLEHMRRTGMSIAEMRKFTALSLKGWRTLADRKALLEKHREHVESEIEEWREALDLIDQKMAYFEEWDRLKKRPPPLPHPPPKGRQKNASKAKRA